MVKRERDFTLQNRWISLKIAKTNNVIHAKLDENICLYIPRNGLAFQYYFSKATYNVLNYITYVCTVRNQSSHRVLQTFMNEHLIIVMEYWNRYNYDEKFINYSSLFNSVPTSFFLRVS